MDSMCRHEHRSTHFGDNFDSLDQQVTTALGKAAISRIILGVDFTKSNERSGGCSFGRRSLHAMGSTPNPYEQAISIIGKTLSPFANDKEIPCFGFGDESTHDRSVFSFNPGNRYCHGFEEALARYREIVPHLKLSGPTSFAPIIDAAIDTVTESKRQNLVLVIVAAGQVTRSPDLPPGRSSPQEQATVNSLVAASKCPLSIVLVGVGDGPWDAMKQFNDNIPQRAFGNFQFVNFTKIMSENKDTSKKAMAFAGAALMQIPRQLRDAGKLFMNCFWECRNGKSCIYCRDRVTGLRTKPLSPPPEVTRHTRMHTSIPDSSPQTQETASAEPVCPICLTKPKNMAFGCGHTTCKDCGASLMTCPLCRKPITTRLRLYA